MPDRSATPHIAGAVSAAAAAGAAALLAACIDERRPPSIDLRIRRAMQTPAAERTRELLSPLFPFGLPGAFIPAAHLVARRLQRRGLAGGPAIVTAAWFGWLGQRGVKLVYHRERPARRGVRRRTDSYPSGHTTGITAVALTTAAVLARRRVISHRAARRLAVGAPAVMGAYRVIADEHWATDVLGGWLCGAAIAIGCVAVLGDVGGARRRQGVPRVRSSARARQPRPARAATG
ncbi:MAG TPA: phosphatase PAP2 family protein [Gemmatimonadaceae bacterium]|nr:phosphatase PAP2 family protein [Gemmatimonadaceae bacterium]